LLPYNRAIGMELVRADPAFVCGTAYRETPDDPFATLTAIPKPIATAHCNFLFAEP